MAGFFAAEGTATRSRRAYRDHRQHADTERDAARAEAEGDPYQAGQWQEDEGAVFAAGWVSEHDSRRDREQYEGDRHFAEPPGLAADLQRLPPGQEHRREHQDADQVAEPPGLPGFENLRSADDARDAERSGAPGGGDEAGCRRDAGKGERCRPGFEDVRDTHEAPQGRRADERLSGGADGDGDRDRDTGEAVLRVGRGESDRQVD